MQVINETHWDTQNLRKLFIAACKAEGHGKIHTIVKMIYSKSGYIHGKAILGGRYIWMYIPKNLDLNNKYTRESFAQIFVHELDHNKGLCHNEMRGHSGINVDWCNDISFKKKEPKPKKQRNIVQERYEHASKMLKKHKTKLKRQETIVKKWSKKVKYYEKKNI